MPPQWAKEHKNLKPGPESAVVRKLAEETPLPMTPPVTPTPEEVKTWRYHLLHYGRDVALMGAAAALTYAASDDFSLLLQQHPEIAAYVPIFQLAARALLSAITAWRGRAK